MYDFIISWILLPLLIVTIIFMIMLVAAIMRKQQMVKVCICILTWMTLFFLFPFVARKNNVIKEKWIAVLLMLVSPVVIATIYIVGVDCLGVFSPYRYHELKFTSKDNIVSLTSLPDFPDYEYHNNSYASWSGTHTVRFLFKEEPPESFFDELESLRKQKDNVFWSRDSLESASDKKFFGSDHIYIYTRGWDGKYMTAPMKDMPESVDLNIFIGKRGFVCRYVELTYYPLDGFGNPDSINVLSGIEFPLYKNVNCRYTEIGPDYEEEWTMMFDKIPSKEFIQQIKNAPNWTEWENKPGCYEFIREIPMKSYDKIIIDENSRVVKAVHGTY